MKQKMNNETESTEPRVDMKYPEIRAILDELYRAAHYAGKHPDDAGDAIDCVTAHRTIERIISESAVKT